MKVFTGSRPTLVLIPLGLLIIVDIFFIINLASEPRLHQIIGMLIANLGLVLWMIARLQFATSKQSAGFATNGLYARLRHPVYYSILLTLIGVILFVWQLYLVPALIALVALQAVRITKAELMLKQQYGTAYQEDRRRTWL